jgi:YfiH family protein
MDGFYRFEHLSKLPECLHGISTRREDAPCGFSLALHTGEPEEVILENRKVLAEALTGGESFKLVLADQTHSDHIALISEQKSRGWEKREDAVVDCDALITNIPGVMLGILTADCVPVLLYDRVKHIVAAVHAGWRGTQKEIVSKTIAKMVDAYGCEEADIWAGIGPAIGQCCYEVDEGVAKYFSGIPDALLEKEGGKYMLNLPYINKYQLLKSGLSVSHIEMSGICTACEHERFFSYRKEQGCSGRFVSLIGIKPKS